MREIKVFISYSHDDKDFVTKLVSDLREKGINVWFDENIPTGHSFPMHIDSNLSTSTHCIVKKTDRANRVDALRNFFTAYQVIKFIRRGEFYGNRTRSIGALSNYR
jgi:hypothetical protein